MSDLISKQAAVDDLHVKDPSQIWDTADVEVWVNALPPAEPKRKRYRHYKTGGIYEIICEAAHHTERAESLVIYRNIKTGGIWARPHWMFYGYTEDGKKRFEEVDT